jgi:hypothetical protein
MARWLVLLSLLVVTLALAGCETDAGSKAGDDTPADAGADVALDAIAPSDAAPDLVDAVADAAVDVGPADTGEPCPQDFQAADGQPCASEGRVCGGPCSDPCHFCNLLTCEAGHWTWMEIFPDPNCGDTVAEVAEVGEVGEVDAGDPCALAGCAMAPVCGSECGFECGCCACDLDEAHCGWAGLDEAALYCQGDCYVSVPCGTTDACVDAGPYGLACGAGFETCADIEAAYAFLTGDDHRTCTADADCAIVDGQCGNGLGGCWHAVHVAVRAEALRALGSQYAAIFCTQAVCDCAPPPAAARCDQGLCVAIE